MKPPLWVVAALAVLLMAPQALAQTEPEPDPGPQVDLSMKMQAPAVTPVVGTSFQLVYKLTNHGPDSATSTEFSQYIPGELEVISASSSDADDTCTIGSESEPTTTAPPENAGGGTTSPGSGGAAGGSPGYYGDSVNCSLGTLGDGESDVITLELRRIAARETYASAWVGSALNDPEYENNYADLFLEADTSNPADVGVSINSPKSPEVGDDFTYALRVTNDGPSTAHAVTVTNPISYGLSFVSVQPARSGDDCELIDYSDPEKATPAYGGYSELHCDMGAIQQGQIVRIEVTVNRASAYEIWGTASVQTGNYDDNYENDYASFSIAADPSVTSDLGVVMRSPKEAPLAGAEFDLVIDVTNHGPAASGDTWLSDYLPPGLAFVSASPADACAFNDSGPYPMADAPRSAPSKETGDSYYPMAWGGVLCAIGSLAPGETTRVTIAVTRTSAQEIWNSSWVSSSNYDPDYENNYSDLVIPADKSEPADVGITMTSPPKPAVASDFDFTIDVVNYGPSPAKNVVVTDYLPYGVEYKSVTSSDPNDVCTFKNDGYGETPPGSLRPTFYGLREVRCELNRLGIDKKATLTIEVNRTSEFEIWNSAWITTANYDTNYENDYASVLVEGESYAGSCPEQGGVEGTDKSDQIVVGNCFAETKAGADTVEVVPSSSGDSKVNSGRGRDTINVNLPLGSKKRRSIRAFAGPGNDLIRITVSPGADKATIYVAAGAGNDKIEIDTPPGGSFLHIVALGGVGVDRIDWTGKSITAGTHFPGFRARGGGGPDLLQGGLGSDRLRGGRGGDRLYGSLGNDILRGGRGYDICRAGPGENYKYGC